MTDTDRTPVTAAGRALAEGWPPNSNMVKAICAIEAQAWDAALAAFRETTWEWPSADRLRLAQSLDRLASEKEKDIK